MSRGLTTTLPQLVLLLHLIIISVNASFMGVREVSKAEAAAAVTRDPESRPEYESIMSGPAWKPAALASTSANVDAGKSVAGAVSSDVIQRDKQSGETDALQIHGDETITDSEAVQSDGEVSQDNHEVAEANAEIGENNDDRAKPGNEATQAEKDKQETDGELIQDSGEGQFGHEIRPVDEEELADGGENGSDKMLVQSVAEQTYVEELQGISGRRRLESDRTQINDKAQQDDGDDRQIFVEASVGEAKEEHDEGPDTHVSNRDTQTDARGTSNLDAEEQPVNTAEGEHAKEENGSRGEESFNYSPKEDNQTSSANEDVRTGTAVIADYLSSRMVTSRQLPGGSAMTAAVMLGAPLLAGALYAGASAPDHGSNTNVNERRQDGVSVNSVGGAAAHTEATNDGDVTWGGLLQRTVGNIRNRAQQVETQMLNFFDDLTSPAFAPVDNNDSSTGEINNAHPPKKRRRPLRPRLPFHEGELEIKIPFIGDNPVFRNLPGLKEIPSQSNQREILSSEGILPPQVIAQLEQQLKNNLIVNRPAVPSHLMGNNHKLLEHSAVHNAATLKQVELDQAGVVDPNLHPHTVGVFRTHFPSDALPMAGYPSNFNPFGMYPGTYSHPFNHPKQLDHLTIPSISFKQEPKEVHDFSLLHKLEAEHGLPHSSLVNEVAKQKSYSRRNYPHSKNIDQIAGSNIDDATTSAASNSVRIQKYRQFTTGLSPSLTPVRKFDGTRATHRSVAPAETSEPFNPSARLHVMPTQRHDFYEAGVQDSQSAGARPSTVKKSHHRVVKKQGHGGDPST